MTTSESAVDARLRRAADYHGRVFTFFDRHTPTEIPTMNHSTQALGAGRMSGEAQQKDRNFIPPAHPDSPAEQMLANLRNSIEGLHSSVSTLTARLSGALHPSVAETGVEAAVPCPGRSPLISGLSDLLQAQYRLDARINELISRIEV